MTFKPPSKLPPPPKWATYIPSRSPEFKIHTSIGPAKNAMLYHMGGILYEWNGTEWVERYTVESIPRLRQYNYLEEIKRTVDIKADLKLIS